MSNNTIEKLRLHIFALALLGFHVPEILAFPMIDLERLGHGRAVYNISQ